MFASSAETIDRLLPGLLPIVFFAVCLYETQLFVAFFCYLFLLPFFVVSVVLTLRSVIVPQRWQVCGDAAKVFLSGTKCFLCNLLCCWLRPCLALCPIQT